MSSQSADKCRLSRRLIRLTFVAALIAASCLVAGGAGIDPASSSPRKALVINSSIPVLSGYADDETFCASKPFTGTVGYQVHSGIVTMHAALRHLPSHALVGVDWSNNTVRGYFVATVRTDGSGASIPGSIKLFRPGETRGYRLVLTWPNNTKALGNLWPCGPPQIRSPAIAIGPKIAVSPRDGLAQGSTVTVTVSGFGKGEKIYVSECDSAEDATDLGCGHQLAAQPFVSTGQNRSGTAKYLVSDRAASTPNNTRLASTCMARCVIVATQGVGFAWAVTSIGFGQSRLDADKS